MRILITGHTGFKGSWMTALLHELGHSISGLSLTVDPNSLYEKAKLRNFLKEDVRVDLRSFEQTFDFISKNEFDLIFHFAAQSLVLESYENPRNTFETNIMGTLNLLDSLRKSGSKAPCVVATTDKVYKEKSDSLEAFNESSELGGRDPYSASKSAADILCQSWSLSFGDFPISIVRGGNVVGGGDWSANRLVPDLVRSYQNKNQTAIRSPESIRPWQHVLDCLWGYWLCAEYMIKNSKSELWNFGSNKSQFKSVLEVANKISNLLNIENLWYLDQEEFKYESKILLIEAEKARNLLGWSNELDFDETMKWTIDFYLTQINNNETLDKLVVQVHKYLERVQK